MQRVKHVQLFKVKYCGNKRLHTERISIESGACVTTCQSVWFLLVLYAPL